VSDAASAVNLSLDTNTELGHDEDEGSEQNQVDLSTETGSNKDGDLVDEDLLTYDDTRATGFIGKASEIQWLRNLHIHGDGQGHQGPYGPPGHSNQAVADQSTALRSQQQGRSPNPIRTSKASFYLDHEAVDIDYDVDAFELPTPDTAEKLLQTYMESCHGSYPFFSRRAFELQFYHYFSASQRGAPYHLPPKWLAQLNLVFAIGATYSHLTSAKWRGDDRDHLIYHSRAWILTLKDPWWFSHPDVPQMQITG